MIRQAYYQSLEQLADSINQNIETNLKALSTFSKKLDDTLWSMERNRIVGPDARSPLWKVLWPCLRWRWDW